MAAVAAGIKQYSRQAQRWMGHSESQSHGMSKSGAALCGSRCCRRGQTSRHERHQAAIQDPAGRAVGIQSGSEAQGGRQCVKRSTLGWRPGRATGRKSWRQLLAAWLAANARQCRAAAKLQRLLRPPPRSLTSNARPALLSVSIGLRHCCTRASTSASAVCRSKLQLARSSAASSSSSCADGWAVAAAAEGEMPPLLALRASSARRGREGWMIPPGLALKTVTCLVSLDWLTCQQGCHFAALQPACCPAQRGYNSRLQQCKRTACCTACYGAATCRLLTPPSLDLLRHQLRCCHVHLARAIHLALHHINLSNHCSGSTNSSRSRSRTSLVGAMVRHPEGRIVHAWMLPYMCASKHTI